MALVIQHVACARSARAENPGRELIREAKRLDESTRAWVDRSEHLQLRILDSRGGERVRELLMRTHRGQGGEDKTLAVFSAPPEIRGTSFLQFAHRNQDAEQWLYLPELKRTRQITARAKSESFMGTDFSYRDLELMTDVLEWSEEEAPSRVVESVATPDGEALLVELSPKAKQVGYERIQLLMTRGDHLIRRMEMFAGGASPAKTLTLGKYTDFAAIPAALLMEMKQHTTGGQTLVTISNVKFNQGLGDDQFSQRAMERGEANLD